MATNKKTETAEAVETVTETTETTETASEAIDAKDDRVWVHIPKATGNEEPNLFVGVNGVNYLLPKGKKSLVPAHVAAEINRSFKAEEKMDEHIEEMLEASKK